VRLIVVHVEPECGGDHLDCHHAVHADYHHDEAKAGAQAQATPSRKASGAQGDRDRRAGRAHQHNTAAHHDHPRRATAASPAGHDAAHHDNALCATASAATDDHAAHHDHRPQSDRVHPAGRRRRRRRRQQRWPQRRRRLPVI
jgi:hypothetical protein